MVESTVGHVTHSRYAYSCLKYAPMFLCCGQSLHLGLVTGIQPVKYVLDMTSGGVKTLCLVPSHRNCTLFFTHKQLVLDTSWSSSDR